MTGYGTQTFAWDRNGNPTNPGFVNTTDNRTLSDGTWVYSYNAAGNLTSKVHNTTTETWTYTYNGDNLLVKAEHKATSTGPIDLRVEFVYDVFGNRVRKSVDSDGDGPGTSAIQKFAYEAGNIWADLSSSGSLTTRRIFGFALDSLIARIGSSSNEDWYLVDRLGSIRDIVNSSGTLINHIDYKSFGAVQTETQPSNGDRYAFAGRERDTETGLMHFRARDYDAALRRFIQTDPAALGVDANLYRYVANTASGFVDPTGLSKWEPYPDYNGWANPRYDYSFYSPDGLSENPEAMFTAEHFPTQEMLDEMRRIGEMWRPGFSLNFIWHASPIAILDTGVSMIPIVGDVKDGLEGIIGVGLITGERLTPAERAAALAGAAIPLVPGSLLRRGGNLISGIVRGAPSPGAVRPRPPGRPRGGPSNLGGAPGARPGNPGAARGTQPPPHCRPAQPGSPRATCFVAGTPVWLAEDDLVADPMAMAEVLPLGDEQATRDLIIIALSVLFGLSALAQTIRRLRRKQDDEPRKDTESDDAGRLELLPL